MPDPRALLAWLARPLQLAKTLRVARALRKQGQYNRASDAYRLALRFMPGRVDIQIQLANMLKDSRRFAEAEATYQAALQADPLNPDIHVQLGHVFKLTGRRGLAVQSYQRATALDPFYGPAWRELAALADPRAKQIDMDAHLRRGGGEALLDIRLQLDRIVAQVDTIRAQLPDALASATFPVEAYTDLRRRFDCPPPPMVTRVDFDVVLLADREPLDRLHAQLSAFTAQRHERWRLWVVGREPDRRAAVERRTMGDPRLIWLEADGGESLAAQEARAVAAGRAALIILMAPGAVLHPQALAWIAHVLEAAPRRAALVLDEEIEELDGVLTPILRQTVDPLVLEQANIYGQTLAVRRAAVGELWTAAPSSVALRSALMLRLVGEGGIAHAPLPLVRTARSAVLGANELAEGHAVAVDRVLGPGPVPTVGAPRRDGGLDEARLAVIVPTLGRDPDIHLFVDSLLQMAAQPDRIEIVVILNRGRDAAEPLLDQLASRPRLRLVESDTPFNWSQLNNQGAALSQAPILLFANDDMRMLTREWDHMLTGLLARPEVGVVGARLLYPDDSLQHAGVLFDWNGSVVHDGLHRPADDPGPNLRWRLARRVGAVTGAFLATRRADFEAVGGFDQLELAISYSDIDYALKLRAAGRAVVWSPQITLHHIESKSRGLDHLDPAKAARDEAERQVMQRRWGAALVLEPGLNPMWSQVSLPLRLLSFPSIARVEAYLRASCADDPWRPHSNSLRTD